MDKWDEEAAEIILRWANKFDEPGEQNVQADELRPEFVAHIAARLREQGQEIERLNQYLVGNSNVIGDLHNEIADLRGKLADAEKPKP